MVTVILVAALPVSLAAHAVAPVAEAHCPRVVEGSYAGGWKDIESATYWASAIEAWIGWTNPTLCANGDNSELTAEWVNICRRGACDTGWAQTGWRKDRGQSTPRGFCEFVGSPGYPLYDDGWDLYLYPITSTAHRYTILFDGGTSEWDCSHDGVLKRHHGISEMGWTQGWWLTADGETNARHGQIGTAAPSKLAFTLMRYKAGCCWSTLTVTLDSGDPPYGRDRPAAGQLRNWTNAH